MKVEKMEASDLYAAVGKGLTRYSVDVDQGTLTQGSTFELPEGLQYMWRHVAKPVLYAACSDGKPGFEGSRHFVCALQMLDSGNIDIHGEPVPVRSRPVHISTDRDSRFVFVTFAKPSRVEVFAIKPDGMLGKGVPQPPMPQLASAAHQLVVTPGNDMAVLAVRGTDAHGTSPEDPGAIIFFDHRDGVLTHRQTVAPDGGYGFGPRHVDFHPHEPWMYVSLERSNQLAFIKLGMPVSDPLCRLTTLLKPAAQNERQLGGAIHVHPDGHTVYVSNRADAFSMVDGQKVFRDGENTIAAFAIDPVSGEPRRAQVEGTRGIHVRTFQIHPSGRLLVCGNMTSRTVQDASGTKVVPTGLSLFRLRSDGQLEFLRKYDIHPPQDQLLFWVGFVPR